jgi:pyruvate-ferredoxin/flavodoxin oxidoreductase
MAKQEKSFKYPGKRDAMDGNTVAIMCERESTDAAGAYPITPSTQMGEYWAEAAAAGHINISGRPLIFIEPEGEHAAAAVTAGLSMTGLRASNFSSGQGIAYMHESLYAAVGKRLPYILNIGARAMTKATLNVHAGHDDYHCIDDTGFFQLFAKNAQEVADLNIVSRKIAELSLTPGALAQDGFLTTHLIESVLVPERNLIAEFLGKPEDIIACPSPAQKIIYGETRRRVPELWTVDNAVMAGVVQNQDSYMQSVAAQRPFFFDHIKDFTEQCFEEYYQLTGRKYERVSSYKLEDADYLIVGQGSMLSTAEAVADYLRETRGIKVGVVNMTMWRPFPGDLIGRMIKGKKGVAVLERLDQPLAVDLPMMREIRATVSRCIENGQSNGSGPVHPEYDTYKKMSDVPTLYSGAFGMGSRDLQPEGLIAAIENMLPDGKNKKQYYLSIDFVREQAYTPKQDIHQNNILESYPHVKDLALRGSENPNLMPKGSITVRFHSVGGWGAITTGKNLAMTLFDLLGYHVKANPKYGSEKKGQPTTYYLSAAPEPIRINCEYFYVDVVLSPDPAVLKHTNALAGLKEGGVFVIQSEHDTAAKVWQDIPNNYKKTIRENGIRVFHIDGFKIAREEASDPELMLRMQGIAFQGAFFKASPVMESAGFTEEKLFKAIEDQLQHKFGAKGARVVEDNLRVVRRGYDEIYEIPAEIIDEAAGDVAALLQIEPSLPAMLKKAPQSKAAGTDVHRFWEQTGNFYMRGMGTDTITDPFVGLSWMPAVTGLFRNMTGIRMEHPEWIPENCTACGKCWTVCPDTAIPGLVSEVSEVFDTAVNRIKKQGNGIKHLPKALRIMEGNLRTLIDANSNGELPAISPLIDQAITQTAATGGFEGEDKAELQREFDLFKREIGDFQFSITRPYYETHEKKAKGSGGLLSITINPYTCKGCMECVAVCEDDALRPVKQTESSIAQLEKDWDFWQDLPTTSQKFVRVDDLEERIGALETILLDKEVYQSLASGDGACLGCSEKTVVHLFTATVTALMQPRVKAQIARLQELITDMEKHIQLRLVETMDVGDAGAVEKVMSELGDGELTLAGIAGTMESMKGSNPIDPEWFKRMTGLLGKLKDLRWKYVEGTTGRGRSDMGMLNSTGCTSVWGSTYPFNPYPFPWANHLFQDSTSVAMGVFEGHMAKMADGFSAVRMAELELAGKLDPNQHDDFFRYFNWEQFSDEEWLLCPPVVALGGDGAMYDIGFQNLSRMMMSGKPIKVVIVDTQVYSNTGGQACTAGFTGQVSDMAQYGKAIKGKKEIRKEIGLIAMAHRTTYVMQSTIAHPSHMIEGFVEGLMTRRPALFNLYTSCPPEHGVGDDTGAEQAKLAVESRAYPLYRYNPDKGVTPAECFDLDMNPSIDEDWPTYELKYTDNGREKSMKVPMTFVDFAVTEGRFRKHFRAAPPDTWNENMKPLHEFLELDDDDRDGLFPYIWAVDRKQRLSRVLVAEPMVQSAQERLDFWHMLKAIAGLDKTEEAGDVEGRVRAEVVQEMTVNLMQLLSGNASAAVAVAPAPAAALTNGSAAADTSSQNGDYMAPWIDTDQCTACDECTKLNNKIFEYNAQKKAVIKDAKGGPYRDLVKAAEKCTAQIIHPGLPADYSEKDVEKWIKRGEKYN